MPNRLTECPACGAITRRYSAADADNYAAWWFECGAEVIDMDGTLVAENPCGDALKIAILKLRERA